MVEELGRRIKAYRALRGLTQIELAEKAHIHANSISGIENGTVDPKYTTLVAIAEALNMGTNELIDKNLKAQD